MNGTAFRLGLMVMAVAGTARAGASLTGTWRCGTDKNPTGELRTIDREGDIQFQLQLWSPPPAENSGLAQGHMTVHGGKAVYETTEFGGKCRIEFTFTSKRVVIKQKRGDWATRGFGHNIEASGAFVRKSSATPQFDSF